MPREIKLSVFSRYTATKLIQNTDEKGQLVNEHFWGTYERIDIPIDDEQDAFFTVTEAFVGRLDKIAHQFYGISELWWVIAQTNLIFDQFLMEIGSVIRIPAFENVFLALTSSGR